MPREKLNEQNNLRRKAKEGYIIVPNYFLREYIKVLGVGPAMFYQYLFTYCHKNKNTAWPSLSTSSKDTGITKKTLTKYYRILIQYGLIKKFSKKKLSSDGYMRNIYQLTPLNGEKITLHKGNFYHNIEEKITPDIGKKLPTNNTNPNNINSTAANRENVAVNFKKLKEKGEEKMETPYSSKEQYTGQAIRERMKELDFKEEFIGKMLKEYSLKKIEENLDLMLERRNIQSPAGWLRAALKNDYQGKEPVRENEGDKCRGSIYQTRLESAGRMNPPPTKTKTSSEDKKILSTEEARERFKLLKQKLEAMKSP